MQLISIIGPTSVGKTAFAVIVAKEILESKNYATVEIISADSRQIYQGLEILTGADIPLGFKRVQAGQYQFPYYTAGKINLHGVAIIKPNDEWSVAHFKKLTNQVIDIAKQYHHLILIVGGTGLYHQQLAVVSDGLSVGPNLQIRKAVQSMNLEELQNLAKQVNQARFVVLNQSDRNNARRLVRVIELGLVRARGNHKVDQQVSHDSLSYVGLNQSFAKIEEKIRRRVEVRFNTGALNEVMVLKKYHLNQTWPVVSTLGLTAINQYQAGLLNKQEAQKQWALHEIGYVKRQLTWWKKRDVTWFNVEKLKWQEQAITYILTLC